MAEGPISLKDLVPFATALLGFAFGWISAIVKDARDRRRAANALVFVLLRMRFELKRLDPKFLLSVYTRFMTDRFGGGIADQIPHRQIAQILAPFLQESAERTLADLFREYSAAVQTLVPYRPILAYRLLGDEVLRSQTTIKAYYQSILANQEIRSDSRAPIVFGEMQEENLQQSIQDAQELLAKDLSAVARASSTWCRLEVWRAIRRQDALTGDLLLRNHKKDFDAQFDSMLNKFSALTPGQVHKSV